jgi:peptide/nickel transport system ATP-binding protein
MAELFRAPLHPYTRALIACEIAADVVRGDKLASIPGEVPDVTRLPPGCIFANRCPDRIPACLDAVPELRDFGPDRRAACIRI